MLDRGLRIHTVLAALALAGVLSWGFGRWWVGGGHAPLRIGWLTAVLLVGMDTPQLTTRLLLDGMRALGDPAVDAVLGQALDGGYWSVGFKCDCAGVFAGVPMSCASTGRATFAVPCTAVSTTLSNTSAGSSSIVP